MGASIQTSANAGLAFSRTSTLAPRGPQDIEGKLAEHSVAEIGDGSRRFGFRENGFHGLDTGPRRRSQVNPCSRFRRLRPCSAAISASAVQARAVIDDQYPSHRCGDPIEVVVEGKRMIDDLHGSSASNTNLRYLARRRRSTVFKISDLIHLEALRRFGLVDNLMDLQPFGRAARDASHHVSHAITQ